MRMKLDVDRNACRRVTVMRRHDSEENKEAAFPVAADVVANLCPWQC